VHIQDRLGIGVVRPIQHKLEVVGESGEAHQPIAYFENTTDTVDGQLVDAYGVMGVCDQSDWAGYGGFFRGGFVGVRGEVFPTDTFSYFGVKGTAAGGSGTNFGTQGYADGDGTSVGARGRANGTDVNYGLWGYATGGLTNYAVHGVVDTTGVLGTYAGYFVGDTYTSGDVGIGTESPDHTFELATDQRVATIYLTTHKNTGFSAGQFVGRSARGSQDAPSNSMEGDWLASFGGKGYSDSGFTGIGPKARMSIRAAENWSDSTNGTHMLFYTTPVGQTGMLERLKISESGFIGIGTPNPDQLLTLSGNSSRIRSYTIDDSEESSLEFMRARAGETAVTEGELLGKIEGIGYEGADYHSGAGIRFYAEGGVGSGSIPGRLDLLTSPGSGSDVLPRLTVRHTGQVGIGTSVPQQLLHLLSDSPGGMLRIQSSSPDSSDKGTIDWYTYQNPDTWAARIGPSSHIDDQGLVIATNFLGDFNNQKDIVFKASDKERMRIKGNGRVGIGTNSPGVRLEVEGETWLNSETVLNDNLIIGRTSLDNHIQFKGSSGNSIFKMFEAGEFLMATDSGVTTLIASGGDFKIQTLDGSLQDRLFVKNTGDIGIGTITPNFELDIAGDLNYTGTLRKNGTPVSLSGDFSDGGESASTHRSLGNTDNFDLGFLTDSVERMLIKEDGKVGVGTANPHGDFQINDHLVFQRTSSDLDYMIANNIHYSAGWKYVTSEIGTVFSLDDNGGFGFATAPVGTAGGAATVTNRLYIANTGNVGIGTTSPNELLEVKGGSPGEFFGLSINQNAASSGYPGLSFRDENDNTLASIFSHQNRVHLYFRLTTGDFIFDRSPSTDVPLIIKESGNVGIGTTMPNSKLQVNGGVQIADDSDAASVNKVGTLRYKADSNHSYVEMCMQTDSTTYAWVVVKQNTW